MGNAVSRSSPFLSQVKNSLNAPTACRRVGPSHLSPQMLHKKEDLLQENLFFSLILYPQLSKPGLGSSPFQIYSSPFSALASPSTRRLQGREQPTAESNSPPAKLPSSPSLQPYLEDFCGNSLGFVQLEKMQGKMLGVFMCFLSKKQLYSSQTPTLFSISRAILARFFVSKKSQVCFLHANCYHISGTGLLLENVLFSPSKWKILSITALL